MCSMAVHCALTSNTDDRAQLQFLLFFGYFDLFTDSNALLIMLRLIIKVFPVRKTVSSTQRNLLRRHIVIQSKYTCYI